MESREDFFLQLMAQTWVLKCIQTNVISKI